MVCEHSTATTTKCKYHHHKMYYQGSEKIHTSLSPALWDFETAPSAHHLTGRPQSSRRRVYQIV